MRSFLCLAALFALAACAAPDEDDPGVYPASGWRTSTGAAITSAEYDALNQSCAARPFRAPFDTDRPVPVPIRDNPAFRPGGEGLASAPQRFAAAERPLEGGLRRARDNPPELLDDCLAGKGLTRDR